MASRMDPAVETLIQKLREEPEMLEALRNVLGIPEDRLDAPPRS